MTYNRCLNVRRSCNLGLVLLLGIKVMFFSSSSLTPEKQLEFQFEPVVEKSNQLPLASSSKS